MGLFKKKQLEKEEESPLKDYYEEREKQKTEREKEEARRSEYGYGPHDEEKE